MKILFAGGGTLGPVTPLLAVAEAWKERSANTEVIWVGTPHGPERHTVSSVTDQFYSLPAARLPRYPSIEWLLLPFKLATAFIKSFYILLKERPKVIGTAGGYTAVPIVIAGKLLGVPSWVHQQDVTPLLTNKILAPFARWITLSWEISRVAFPFEKSDVIGNPVRKSLFKGSREDALTAFGLDANKSTVLVFGGGGGARWINHAMEKIGSELERQVNVIHIAGNGKITKELSEIRGNYHVVELLTSQMADALAVADVVVCRAGMGTITELAALKKAAIIIPLPRSSQLANIHVIHDGGAAKLLMQETTTPGELLMEIMKLARDPQAREHYGVRMHALLPTDVSDKLVDLLSG